MEWRDIVENKKEKKLRDNFFYIFSKYESINEVNSS